MKYTLRERIGAGGMGEVFRTDDPHVVVKRLLPHLAKDPRFVTLFLEEARVAARLHHPNIVELHELGEVDGTWFIAMEYVDGKSLDGLGAVPALDACRIGEQIAAALDHAHKARDAQGRLLRVVHRDVSPHNILVARDGTAKLIDFGVARAVGGGRPAYAAPEQADGGDGDAKSDQFSLGVVLWELVSGRKLFEAEDDAATLQNVLACNVPPPPKLEGPVMRALSRDPKRRFPDCRAFAEALRLAEPEIRSP